MALKIKVKEEAKANLADAMQWYASKAENLDIRFINAVETTLLKIQRNSTAFKKVHKQFSKPQSGHFRMLSFISMRKRKL